MSSKPFDDTLNLQTSCPVCITKSLAVALGSQSGILCIGSITFAARPLEGLKIQGRVIGNS